MFTECPECETTFRLSAEDLRRAHGKVRCGECHQVFNALESLAEEPEDSATDASKPGADYRPRPAWLIDSANNPPGDLDPDLETYENTAYLPEGEVEFEYEFDEDDDDDSGVILYIDDESRTASNADTMEDAPADADDLAAAGPDFGDLTRNHFERDDPDDGAPEDVSLDTTDFGSELADIELAAELDDDAFPDFDETIWERIPGVAAAEPRPAAATPAAPPPPAAQDTADLVDSADPVDTSPAAEPAATTTDYRDSALDVWVAEGGSTLTPEDPAAAADAADTDDTDDTDHLEFDVPAENWNQFFEPAAQGPQPIIWEPPALEEPAVASSAATDAEVVPSWHGEDAAQPPAESRGAGWLQFAGGLLLVLFFAAQLLHYNRDALAAHPEYGAWVRAAYGALDQTLYPAWSLLNNYEIRGSEAVVGESGPDVMDIRAQIVAIGTDATGLPRLRVVLRDRWSNPVAATDFGPSEYAAAADLPADGLLQPGVVIPARVSVADPGSGVQGFELELCLPRRGTGLECTDQPFQ